MEYVGKKYKCRVKNNKKKQYLKKPESKILTNNENYKIKLKINRTQEEQE